MATKAKWVVVLRHDGYELRRDDESESVGFWAIYDKPDRICRALNLLDEHEASQPAEDYGEPWTPSPDSTAFDRHGKRVSVFSIIPRIIACVNACAGIPSELLARGVKVV